MKDYNLSLIGRRSLGKALRSRNPEEHHTQEPVEVTKIYCGVYEKNTIVRGTIIRCISMDEFYFSTEPQITPDQYEQMKIALSLKHRRSNALSHLARPYTSDLGQIKFYYDLRTRTMHRSKIVDLYPVVQGLTHALSMNATLFLLDKGTYEYNVPFKRIFDAPQTIRYLKDIEPEVKSCRIHLGEPVPLDYADAEINNYFCQRIAKSASNEFNIKIIDHKDGLYHVDLLDKEKRSFIEHMRSKFKDKIVNLVIEKEREGFGLLSRYDLSLMNELHKVTFNGYGSAQERLKKRNPRYYQDLFTYFRQRLSSNLANPKLSFLQKRFLRVKIFSWRDPDSFYIAPDDPDYINHHNGFVTDVQANRAKAMCEEVELEHVFKIGDICYFQNKIDKTFGEWVRGIVVEAPSITRNYVVMPKRFSEIKRPEIGEFRDIVDKLVYRVESIDYGFISIGSARSMRRVLNKDAFFCRGAWSIKCRLFGISPLTDEVKLDGAPRFNETCLALIDSWMRERIADNGKHAYFYIMFRGDLKNLNRMWISTEPCADITIFHRFEPPYSIGDCFLPRKRKTRYDCLNTYLIDKGVACDYIHQLGVSSNVDLDQFAVNLLVPHDRI